MALGERQGQDLRSWIPAWIDRPWVGRIGFLTGLGLTAIGVGLNLYFGVWPRSDRYRELTYAVHPVKVDVFRTGGPADLRLFYRTQEVQSDVTAALVAIWNRGRESIRPINILSDHVRIETSPRVRILEASIVKTSRSVIGFSLEPSAEPDYVIPVTWKILEKDDGAVIQLLFEGTQNHKLLVQGVVEGQPSLNETVIPSPIKSPAEQITEQRALNFLIVLLAAAYSVIIVLNLVFRIVRRRLRSVKEFAISTIAAILLGGFAAYVIFLPSRQPGPPFGWL